MDLILLSRGKNSTVVCELINIYVLENFMNISTVRRIIGPKNFKQRQKMKLG